MKLGIVRQLVFIGALAALTAAPASLRAQQPQRQPVIAQGMGVVEIPEGTESIPVPSPDPAALTNLAERLAQPDPDAETPAATTPAQREAQPLGTPSRAGEVVTQQGFTGDDGGWVLNTLAALGLVIGLILLLRWGWTKMGGVAIARSSPVVEVLSRTSVAPRNHVLLVRVGGRILILSDSSSGLRTLANIDDPDEVANLLEAVTAARGNSITRGFMQMLNQTDEAYDKVRLREEGGDHAEYRIDRARDTVSGLLARVKALSGKGEAR